MDYKEILRFSIGSNDWVREARSFTDQFDPTFWDGFRRCREEEIAECERIVRRTLPDDFREFLLEIGSGKFENCGGSIYTPEMIPLACPGPLWSLLKGARSVSEDELCRFYASRGAENPRPDIFNSESLNVDGVNLFDLLQIGVVGNGCYFELYLGVPPRPFGFCHLDPTGVIEERLPSFTDGLKLILIQAWETANGLDDEIGLSMETDFRVVDE